MSNPNPTSFYSAVAIPLPSEEEIRRVIGDGYDSKSTLNVVKMAAGTGDMYPSLMRFVSAVFSAQGITPRTREMIILRVSKVLNAPYEWQANIKMAANTGLSQEEVDAAAADGQVTGVCPEYILVCKAADELTEAGMLKDETITALLAHFGEQVARKVVLMIAWFNMLSLFLNGCRVPLETTEKIGSKTSPLA